MILLLNRKANMLILLIGDNMSKKLDMNIKCNNCIFFNDNEYKVNGSNSFICDLKLVLELKKPFNQRDMSNCVILDCTQCCMYHRYLIEVVDLVTKE